MATSTPTPSAAGDVRSTVNNLIETCRDGQKGFDVAASGVDDPVLKAELLQYSGQRSEFAQELVDALAQSGEAADDSGSLSAAAHRGWIKIKELVTGKDRYAILAECERGEDVAVAAYRKAAAAALPQSIANIVSTQHQAIQRVHDRVKALRDAAKK